MPKREPEPLLREDGVPIYYMRPIPDEPVEEVVTSNASEGVVIEEPEPAPQEESI